MATQITTAELIHEAAHAFVGRAVYGDALLDDQLDLSGHRVARYVATLKKDAATPAQDIQCALAGCIMDYLLHGSFHENGTDYLQALSLAEATGIDSEGLTNLLFVTASMVEQNLPAIEKIARDWVADLAETDLRVAA